MAETNGNSRIPNWLLQVLATAFLLAMLTGATHYITVIEAHGQSIAVVQVQEEMLRGNLSDLKSSMERVEMKLDQEIVQQKKGGGK